MLKSLLPKSFQLYNHIFHVQFGSWHSGEKQELLDTGDSVFFINTSNHFKASRYSFRAPWRLYKQLTVYVTWTIIVSCQIPKCLGQVRRTLCWNFPRQIWDIRKDKEFSPINQAVPQTCSPRTHSSVVSRILRPDDWSFLWYKHIDLHPLRLFCFAGLTQGTVYYGLLLRSLSSH